MAAHCEDMHPIDMALLNRYHLVKRGVFSEVRWVFRGRETGKAKFTLESETRMYFVYSVVAWGGKHATAECNVLLASTRQPLGGVRKWFKCPSCGRACRVLYARAGFRCRLCAKLVYLTQKAASSERALIRAQKLHMRVGGSGSLTEPFPPKPRFMHSKTYHRLEAVYARLAAISLSGLSAKLAKIRRP
jgi:hypothetical protein